MPEEITFTVYQFDELSPAAQTKAVEQIREKLNGDWWDGHDNNHVQEAMVMQLAESLRSPGWDTDGAEVTIDGVSVEGWTLDVPPGELVLSGTLTRDNAPRLHWTDRIDHVKLSGRHVTSIEVVITESECTCPPVAELAPHEDGCPTTTSRRVSLGELLNMRMAVRDAIQQAWSAGEKEADYLTSEEKAREVAADGFRFHEDGTFYS